MDAAVQGQRPCGRAWEDGGCAGGGERAGGQDGESDSLWRFAERTSGDDEPDAVASRLQNLLEAVFYGHSFFFPRANLGCRVFWRCPKGENTKF